MESFSQRYGYKPTKTVIQIASMDTDLRNSLWNALDSFYWIVSRPHELIRFSNNSKLKSLFDQLWLDYFKKPIDTIQEYPVGVQKEIRDYFFGCEWNEAYDFVEFVANNYSRDSVNKEFIDYCNSILKREVSGYRFIGGKISPITSEEEITEIEEALQSTKSLEVIHLKSALDLFSDRQSPDYRNSIKESISAVEAICRLITGSDATLGKALGEIQRLGTIELNKSLRNAFDQLYAYTSDADGIRHALLDETDLDSEDAKFMLVSCSAFINYLKVKASKAGIDLGTK